MSSGKCLSFKLRLLISLAALTTLVGVGLVRSLSEFAAEEERLSVFDPYVDTYLSAVASSDFEERSEAFVRGKVIVVDVENRSVHAWALGLLPQELQAGGVSEVGTVAVLERKWEHFGHYVNESTGEKTDEAFLGIVEVSLIEWPSQEPIAMMIFEGDEPAARILDGGITSGGLPVRDAIRWIGSLPRR